MYNSISKKKVVIYGNCHTEAIYKILSMTPSFSEKYELCPILPICQIKSDDYFKQKVFSECDVFIHQSIRLNNRYGEQYASEKIIRLLKHECKIIAIPNVYHMPICFFSQYSPKEEFKRKGVTYFFRDYIIDTLYNQGYSIKKIIEKYDNNNILKANKMHHDFEEFIEKVQFREKDWDIKISKFILDNYRQYQLFFDPNHPTMFLLKYIAKSCMDILEVEYTEEEINKISLQEACYYEMPICKITVKELGLNYGTKELRIGGNKLLSEKMFLKQYVRQYIAFEWQNKELNIWLRIKSKTLYIWLNFVRIIRNIGSGLKHIILLLHSLVVKRYE